LYPARESLPAGVAPLEPSDPTTIGGYRLLGRLGVGGMASVYLGGDGTQRVAVKVIHPHLAQDAEFRARFLREIQLARRVPDFCTAPVRADGQLDGRPFLVTEFLDGMALHQLVQRDGPLAPDALHNLAVGVVAALTAVHDCDLVHRDLKPSNVMVTLGGVRIIDFGIARALDLSTGYTATGLVMGSLGWSAPEQLDGREPMPAMDIFGWGCLVAYAGTGDHPFGGTDATSRSWRILNAEPDLRGLPDGLRDLVAATLVKDPAERPTAQELLLALVSAPPGGSGRPSVRPAVLSGRRSFPAQRRRFDRRHRVAAVLAVPLALGAVVAVVPGLDVPFVGWDGSPTAPHTTGPPAYPGYPPGQSPPPWPPPWPPPEGAPPPPPDGRPPPWASPVPAPSAGSSGTSVKS
jgi:serine/threonine protein kinase